jgi:Zn-finger nucleic acid-binding protein
MYLNCPSCGLSFRVQAMDLVIEKCPRCLARAGRVTKLLASDLPQVVSRLSLGSSDSDAPPAAAGEAAAESAV